MKYLMVKLLNRKIFFEEHYANNESSSSSSSRLDESRKLNKEKPVFVKRTEIEPSEDEVYSYVRIEQLRYRWE